MKKLIILVAAAFSFSPLAASMPGVAVSAELRKDNSLDFIAEVTGYGTFSVELIFSNVENSSSPERVIAIVNGNGRFFTLAPEDKKIPVKAEFVYNWIQGAVDSDVDYDFVYRLPFPDGTATTAQFLSHADLRIFRGNFRDFTVWRFPLKEGTVIYPVRKGVVTGIQEFNPSMLGGGTTETDLSLHNSIFIQHADGTIAQYGIMETSSLAVAEGDTVYPDTPLAKAGTVSEGNYAVQFALFHYAGNRSERHPNMFSQTVYLNPVFSTTDGNIRLTDGQTITAKVSQSIIDAEKPVKRSFWRRLFGKK